MWQHEKILNYQSHIVNGSNRASGVCVVEIKQSIILRGWF
jgi:hypothetical protein